MSPLASGVGPVSSRLLAWDRKGLVHAVRGQYRLTRLGIKGKIRHVDADFVYGSVYLESGDQSGFILGLLE